VNLAATIAYGLVLLSLQSAGMFPLTWGALSADLALCLVVHLALTRDLPNGGVSAAAIGYMTDLAAGAPPGLHVVAYVAIFLTGLSVRSQVFITSAPMIAAAILVASLMVTVVTFFLAAIFVPDYTLYMPFLLYAFPRAVLTVPFIFPVRALALRIDRRTIRRSPALFVRSDAL
jgi:cell shape-determining protein MreD